MGNICYLISIIQILYNLKSFKNDILNLKIVKEDKNVLVSTQKIFLWNRKSWYFGYIYI